MTYECIACGTTFNESDGVYKYGWLVCPSCEHEDIKPIDMPVPEMEGVIGE
jgi:formylmethanofuran dehydrogenase subunit E